MCRRIWLGTFFLLLLVKASAQTNFATLTSDGCWTWFDDPRAIFHNGTLFFGYVQSAGGGHSALSTFNLQSGRTTNLWLSTLSEDDDHDVPGLQVRQDGTMFANYARHGGDQFFSYRISTSTNPVSPASWGAEQQLSPSGAGLTYANPYQLSAESGKMYEFSRDLNYNPTVFTSTNAGATWSGPQLMIKTGTGSTRPYVKYCSDYTSRVDVLYTDAHPDNYTNSLYHMYYQGGAFYQTDGTFMTNFATLPILHDNGQRGSLVYLYSDAPTVDPNQWISTARAWCWEIAYQSNGAPFCVFQTKVDNVTGTTWSDARIYYYYARWTGTIWQKRFIAQAGRPLYNGQPDYGGGMALDPLNPNVIYISSDAANPFDLTTTTNVPLGAHYEIYKGVTADGGLTFTWTAMTTNSVVDNCRPYVPRRFGGEPCVLWWRGTYTAYTSFSTSVVGLFTTAVPVPTNSTTTAVQIPVPVVKKANNTAALNQPGSWVGGVTPNVGSAALWDTTVTGANAVALGANASWAGIIVSNVGGPVSITAGNTLTLGSAGIDMSSATAGLTISSGLTLGGGNQAWNVTNGQTLALSTGAFTRGAGATLNVTGAGVVSSSQSGLANDASNGGGILGPWATAGAGANTAYAVLSGGNITGYAGGIAVAYNTIPSSATAATNYVINSAGSVAYGAATRTMNTLTLATGATTLTWGNSSSQINLIVNGILNSGSGLFTLAQGGTSTSSGVMIGANNNRELVLNAANAPITVSARIIDNTGGVSSSLTVVGGPTNPVTLSGVNTYTGGTTFNAGNLVLGNASGLGSSSGILTINGGTLDLGGFSPAVGAVTINGGVIQDGTLTGKGFTANNPLATSVSAALAGASATLVKNGPGALTLLGANTYTGTTTINAGTLDSDGSISGAVTVTGGWLGGNGSIGGAVTVQSGGTLGPGADGNTIGTLTVNNSFTLQPGATTFIKISKNGDGVVSDSLNGVSTLTMGGTLVVSNLSANALAVRDAFQIFSATNSSGAFTSISPTVPGVGLVWNTNSLAANGVLSVALGTVRPQISQTALSGGNFVIAGSGGAAGYGYSILGTTNLSVPLINWSLVATGVCDNLGNLSVTNAILPGNRLEFYLIRIP